MIVQCAACRACFRIAADKVTERGVRVRCPKCSTVFVVRKDSGLSAADVAAAALQDSPGPSHLQPGDPSSVASSSAAFESVLGSDAAENPIGSSLSRQAERKDAQAGARPSAPAAPAFVARQESRSAPFASVVREPEASDPFRDLDLHTPARPPSDKAPAPFAEAPFGRVGGAPPSPADDPFAGIDMEERKGVADVPFADVGRAPPRPPPSPTDDPFAGIDIEERRGVAGVPFGRVGGAPLPPPSSPTDDPFAGIDIGERKRVAGVPLARANVAAPPPSPTDPFAGIDVEERKGVADVPFADVGRAPPQPPPSPRADPFAGIDVEQGKAVAAANPFDDLFNASAGAARPLPERAPAAVPSELDLANVELPPAEGLDLDAPAPAREPEPEPPEGPVGESQTVIRRISWRGGANDSVDIQSLTNLHMHRPASAPRVRRRSPLVSLAVVVLFLVVGGFVLEQTSRHVYAARAAQRTPGTFVVDDVGSGLYPNREGGTAFVVRGTVMNRSLLSLGPAVKIAVELRRGDLVIKTAEGYAGAVPSPEDLWNASTPTALAEIAQRWAATAKPLAPGKKAGFVVVFSECPEDLADLTFRIRVAPSVAPALPKADETDGPSKPDGAEGAAGARSPAPEAPKRAQKSKAGAASGFPTDNPPRQLKLRTGEPGAIGATPP